MRALYVPDWVFTALKAQGYQRSDVLNPEILKSILSVDDVAFLSLIQDRLDQVLPKSMIETFHGNSAELSPTSGKLACRWWPDGNEWPEGFIDRKVNMRVNGVPENFKTPYSNLSCEMMDEDTIVFYPIKPLGECILHDGIGVQKLSDKLALLDRVIQEVYSFVTFQDLALTPIMKDYLITGQLVQRGNA